MISEAVVARLIESQFPEWKHLPIRQVDRGGWDNRMFHLGDQMLVRLPSGGQYAAQVEKEVLWLPILAPHLPLAVPVPLAVGNPGFDYPYKWSVYEWIDAEIASRRKVDCMSDFAKRLAQFISALQQVDPSGGPPAGVHNFYRGGSLRHYNREAVAAICRLEDKIDTDAARVVWSEALASQWQGAPVWVHGDISSGNLLVKEGALHAVIDFGMLGVGDPACDLVIAWTFFEGEARDAFRDHLNLDRDTWARARGWGLWKALIVAAGLTDSNAVESENPLPLIAKYLF